MTTLQKQYVLTKTEHVPLIEVEENRQQSSSPNNAEERKSWMFLDEKANKIKMDVNSKDINGASALHIFVQGKETLPIYKERAPPGKFQINKTEIQATQKSIDMFQKRGFDLNAKDIFQETPLHYAVKFANYSAVYALCLLDVNVDVVNENNETPLHLACSSNYSNICKLLITGRSPIFGNDVLQIKKKASLIKKDRNGNTPLHLASSKTNFAMVCDLIEEMMERGTSGEYNLKKFINETNNAGDTALLLTLNYASKSNNNDNKHDSPKLAKYLIENGASIGAQNADGLMTLHLAAKHGILEIAKLCLELDSNSGEISTKLGDTPLHFAARHGHTEIVNALLDYCTNFRKPNANSLTPFDEAVINGHEEIVQIFLTMGANPMREGCLSSLHLAIDHKQSNVAKLLLSTDKWEDMLKKCRKRDEASPYCELLKANMHDVVKTVLDKCIKPINSKIPKNDINYEEAFDFTYLDDITWNDGHKSCGTFCVGICCSRKHPLSLILQNCLDTHNGETVLHGQYNLLSHRLVRQFILNKWTSYLIVYAIEILLYACFVGCLISYANIHPPPYNYESKSKEYPNEKPYYRDNVELFIVLLAFTLIHLVKEILQSYMRGIVATATNIQNYFEISTYLFTLLFMFNCSNEGCHYYSGIKTEPSWFFGVIACFLAWINVIFLLNKNPTLAVHIEMITYVFNLFYNVFIFIFLFFILAFAMAFHMLFKNQDSFQDYGTSITKTLVMMIGEFDYMTVFHSNQTEISGKINFPTTSTVFFLVFATTMTILCMNVLVALSVDKITTFQNTAKLKQMKKAVKLFVEFELLKHWFRQKNCFRSFQRSNSDRNIYIVAPNKKKNSFSLWIKKIVDIVLPICKDVDFEMDEPNEVYNTVNNKIEHLSTIVEKLQSDQNIIFRRFEEFLSKIEKQT